MLEYTGSEIDRTEHVTEPRRQQFAFLQVATERQHREIGGQRKRRTVTIDVLIVAARWCIEGYAAEFRMRQREEERACDVADRVTDVTEQGVVELDQATIDVFVAGGCELTKHEGMAANRPLPVDDQAARQDVRAFDRDRDRGGY